jgi:hypothetical protein
LRIGHVVASAGHDGSVGIDYYSSNLSGQVARPQRRRLGNEHRVSRQRRSDEGFAEDELNETLNLSATTITSADEEIGFREGFFNVLSQSGIIPL